jgi:transcriptional regulator with XRE-family HTH domain
MAIMYWRRSKRGRRKPIPKEPGANRSNVAQAILQARRAAGLTQDELGRRVGLKGRAVYRWERDDSAPTKRNRAALVTAFTAIKPELGAWFAHAVAGAADAPKEAASTALAAPSPPSGPNVLEHAVFTLADELDLAPRRARGALKRFVARLGQANLGLDTVQELLEEWIERAE